MLFRSVTLTVSDGNGGSASFSFAILVLDQAPVVSTTSVSFCAAATSLQPLAATDDDGAAILLQPDRETPEGAKVK